MKIRANENIFSGVHASRGSPVVLRACTYVDKRRKLDFIYRE